MQGKEEARAALQAHEPVLSLASLIEVAVEDAEELDRDRYSATAGNWHSPSGFRCNICLAGMTMAGTLGKYREEIGYPGHYPEPTARALFALNSARKGEWVNAYNMLTGRLGTAQAVRDAVEVTGWPPEPSQIERGFRDWHDFDLLAERLREAVPVLREIEALAFGQA